MATEPEPAHTHLVTVSFPDGTERTIPARVPATHAVITRWLAATGPRWRVLRWAETEATAHRALRHVLRGVADNPAATQVQIVPVQAQEVTR